MCVTPDNLPKTDLLQELQDKSASFPFIRILNLRTGPKIR